MINNELCLIQNRHKKKQKVRLESLREQILNTLGKSIFIELNKQTRITNLEIQTKMTNVNN